MINIGAINIFIGILLIIISIPLVLKKIKMNRLYGFRIAKSFESEENWFKINEYGGKLFIYWAILIIVSGIFYRFIPSLNNYDFLFRLFPLIIFIPIIQVLIYAKNK